MQYVYKIAKSAGVEKIKLGEYSLMASDIIDAIPSVLNFR
jgi:hypothetical protein